MKQLKFLLFGLLAIIFIPTSILAQQINCDQGTNTAGSYLCSNVNLKSAMNLSTLSSSAANDIWGWKSPNTNKEYAIIGLRNGYAFVDISDPVNPVKIGNLPSHSGESAWGDIKVHNNYAYLVSEANAHHIQVFDLLQLDEVNNPPLTFNDMSYSIVTIGNGNAHNIVVDEESDFVYSVGTRSLCSGGLAAHDLSDPANPTFAGCFSGDGYSHDAICFIYRGEDTEHIGKQICIGFNENTYTIVDMSDKSNPVQLSRGGYGAVNYTHQGWVTDDHQFLLLNDELDEQQRGVNTSTFIFNLSDLDNHTVNNNPAYHDTFVAAHAATDHNLYIKGSYAYATNYSAGLRILDLTNIETVGGVTEAAYFDFFPANNGASFASVWSNYPYFKSGNIIVSDFEQGLFVVEPQLPHFVMDFEKRGGIKRTCTETSVSYEIDLTAYAGFAGLVNLTLSNIPSGVTHSFSNNNTDPNGNTVLTLNGVNTLSVGNYHLLLEATATGSPDQKIALGLIKTNVQNVATPSLQTPVDAATSVPTMTTLEWATAGAGLKYDVQVATDVDFNNIVNTGTSISGLTYDVSSLNENTTYYWRTRVELADCTTPEWAVAYSFQTLNCGNLNPALNLPEDGATEIALSPLLEWTEPSGGATYDLQVATDASFTSLVASPTNLSTLNYQAMDLGGNTTYFWRVRVSSSLCVSADWGAARSFQTANQVQACNTIESANIPVAIPNQTSIDPFDITSTLDVTESGIIDDINVLNLDITHTYVGDLSATLTSPAGTVLTLFNQPGISISDFGCEENNMLVSFDDNAAANNSVFNMTCDDASGTAIAGTFQSFQGLVAFEGQEMQGTWTLTITDHYGTDDEGTLNGWGLQFCTLESALPISLINFDAMAQKESILLSWEVASQLDNKAYEIWRSTAPNTGFKMIAELEAEVSKNFYELEDTDVVANTIYYYQLKQKDDNGKSVVSYIVQAHIATDQPSFALVPNPAKEQVNIQLSVPMATNEALQISLISLDGKILHQVTFSNGGQSYPLSLVDLSTGIYLVRMQSKSGVEVKRLVVN